MLALSKSGGLEGPYGLLLRPDGKLYVGGKDNIVKRYDVQTGAFLGDFMKGNDMINPNSILFRSKPALP